MSVRPAEPYPDFALFPHATKGWAKKIRDASLLELLTVVDKCLEGPATVTHAADAMARVVLRNALFPLGRERARALTIPWCTYTDLEVGHVGLSEQEAKETGLKVRVYRPQLTPLVKWLMGKWLSWTG